MNIIASISKENLRIETVPRPDSASADNSNLYQTRPASIDIIGTRQYADIYIKLTDENGNAVNGNYAAVPYQEYFNGVAGIMKTVQIPGSSYPIGLDVLVEDTTEGSIYTYDVHIAGSVTPNDNTYTPPGVCDAQISSISIDKKESTAGAHDGQVTILATSTNLPLQYSLNGTDYQASATFTNLAGGAYTAYIQDASGCSASLLFNLNTTTSLLIADPAVTLSNGNTSRWSAAFNPVVFTYQRKDFDVTGITIDPTTLNIAVIINGAFTTTVNGQTVNLAEKDYVYLNAGSYYGTYQVVSLNAAGSTMVLNKPFVAGTASNTSGFMNIDKLRPYYKINTQLTYQDKLTGQTETITCTHRPNNSGVVKADLSSFLQSLLRAKDDSDFTQPNFRDDNLSASYTISYAEEWDGQDSQQYISMNTPYYVVFAAKQLGDAYGGNLAAYVPFKNVLTPGMRARWITDFTEPAYSNGYPFDIGFIYSEALAGLSVYAEITPLDINRNPLANGVQTINLLNEDSSFLLNQDGSKLVIFRQPGASQPVIQPVAEHIGLNRLLINLPFTEQVCFFNLILKYNDDQGTHTITQTQTVRVDNAVDDQSVYLRWIGLTGSWNYYRFVYNQEVTLDVQNAVIVKNLVSDWAMQDSIEEVISKSAGQKMKVMAEDLSVADIKGLQSLKYSPKVQMLTSKNPVKWQTVVLNTATFAEYDTRNGQAPFSVTFNLPSLNIQTQ